MFIIPKELYVVNRKNRMFGHVKHKGSIVFAFTTRDDAMIVKRWITYAPDLVKTKNTTYVMNKKNPIAPAQVAKANMSDLFTFVCSNNMNVALISSVCDYNSFLELNCVFETEADLDSDSQKSLLETLYTNY